MRITIFLLLLLAPALAGHACTLCNSKTAVAVRASVYGPGLLINLAITILPFLICSFIVYLIYHGGFTKK